MNARGDLLAIGLVAGLAVAVTARSTARRAARDASSPHGSSARRNFVALPRFRFTHWTCRDGPEQLVDVIKHRVADLSYGQAIRRVDLKGSPVWWDGMPTDWSADYWETVLPSGERAYVLQHGGIEHIFTASGNLGDEGPLAERMVKIAEKWSDADRIPTSTFRDMSTDEVAVIREAAKKANWRHA